MITQEQIKKNIVELLKSKEVSQTQLSREIGVGQSTISHYIKGDICPSLETFANLCKALQLEQEEICEILCVKEEF